MLEYMTKRRNATFLLTKGSAHVQDPNPEQYLG